VSSLFAVTAFFSVLLASAQGTEPAKSQIEDAPRFEDFPVTEIFRGAPAAPLLITPGERLYRTRIRNGVSKGEGVWRDKIQQPGVNFAGHYIIVGWMCGSPCGMMAVIDALTGRVYKPPISGDDEGRESFMLPWVVLPDAKTGAPWVANSEYRPTSSLFIMKVNDVLKDQENYTHYFLWKNNQWNLLWRIPMEPSAR
jgi:hypothetical protein